MKKQWKALLCMLLALAHMPWVCAAAQEAKFIQIDGGFGLKDDGTVWKLPLEPDAQMLGMLREQLLMGMEREEVKMTQIEQCVNIKKISAYADENLTYLDGNGVAISYIAYMQAYVEKLEGVMRVCQMENVKDICAGDTATLFVKEDGSVWVWGRLHNSRYLGGKYGGPGECCYILEPVQIPGAQNPIGLFAKFSGEIGFIDADGKAWRIIQSAIEQTVGDIVWDVEDLTLELEPYQPELTFRRLESGQERLVGILEDGQMYISNYWNKQPSVLANPISDVIDVDSGEIVIYNIRDRDSYKSLGYTSHLVALKADGTVWESENIGGKTEFHIKGPGEVWTGYPVTTEWHQIRGLENVIDIDAYEDKIIALQEDGTIIQWGPEPQIVSTEYPQPLQGRYYAISLSIRSPLMYFNNELCEIDPGRGTIPGARNNRTNIPIRNLVEKIGGTVDWEAETETVTIRLWEHEVQMQLGSNIIMVDGEEKNMDVAPYEENGRTMVPIRFMAENLGFDVEMCSSAGFYNSIVVISCKELLDVQ